MLRLLAIVVVAAGIGRAGNSGVLVVKKPHATPTPAVGSATLRNAPADTYFGPLKVSPVRIRLQIDDLADRYNRRTASDEDLVHDALLDEAAMHAWLDRYPNDIDGPPAALHLAQLYAEIQTTDARYHARTAFAYVAQKFGATKYGHMAKARLAQGFPNLHAETPVVAAAPSGAPSAGAGDSAASPGAATGPSAAPGATASPISTSSPSAAPPSPSVSPRP